MVANMEMERKGDKLVITVDLKQKGRPSGSGKTQLIASSGGNAAVPGSGDFQIGLNVFRKL